VPYSVSDIFAGAALFQMLIFSILLLTKRTANPVSNGILAAFLFSNVLCLVNLLVFKWMHHGRGFLLSYFFGFSFSILWGPLLYLYTRSVTRRHFRIAPSEFMHGLPFAAYFVFMILVYLRFGAALKGAPFTPRIALTWDEHLIVIAAVQGLILAYTLLCFVDLRRYRIQIRKTMSSVERHNLSWLTVVLWGFMAHWTLDTAYYVVLHLNRRQPVLILVASFAVLLIFAQLLVFKSMRQPLILFGLEQKPKYHGSPLTDLQKRQYLAQLEKIMSEQKPFLDPMLTLPQLARKAHIPPRYLSQVLNETLEQSFFDYINSRRIEESKRLLREKSLQGATVLEILLEVGFNSKSSFNSAFKRYTGMTPTAFIRSA
jgi:AraC-like DNA-binding protein